MQRTIILAVVALAMIAIPIISFLIDYPKPGKNPLLVASLVCGLVVEGYAAYATLTYDSPAASESTIEVPATNTNSDDVDSKVPNQEPVIATSPLSDDDYILPESSLRYYELDELDQLSNWELWMARNEMYARHGRKFTNEEVQDYFYSKWWYEGLYTPDEFDVKGTPKVYNDYEKVNRARIEKLEAQRNSPYA